MNDNELHELIKQTHPNPEFSTTFQREIWARIAVAEQSTWQAKLRNHAESFFRLLSQPAPAVAGVAAMLILGIGIGQMTKRNEDSTALRDAYITSINPLAAAANLTIQE